MDCWAVWWSTTVGSNFSECLHLDIGRKNSSFEWDCWLLPMDFRLTVCRSFCSLSNLPLFRLLFFLFLTFCFLLFCPFLFVSFVMLSCMKMSTSGSLRHQGASSLKDRASYSVRTYRSGVRARVYLDARWFEMIRCVKNHTFICDGQMSESQLTRVGVCAQR